MGAGAAALWDADTSGARASALRGRRAVTATISIGPLQSSHCSQIEEIVRATGVFSEAEIGVALELFDVRESGGRTAEDGWRAAHGSAPSAIRHPPSDYEFLGAFHGDSLVGYACFGPTPSTD